MSEHVLKPCPFCGRKPKFRFTHGLYSIGCPTAFENRHALNKCKPHPYVLSETKADAETLWNTRTPADNGEVEELRQDFLEYARHLPTCPMPQKPCDCGFEQKIERVAALAKVKGVV